MAEDRPYTDVSHKHYTAYDEHVGRVIVCYAVPLHPPPPDPAYSELGDILISRRQNERPFTCPLCNEECLHGERWTRKKKVDGSHSGCLSCPCHAELWQELWAHDCAGETLFPQPSQPKTTEGWVHREQRHHSFTYWVTKVVQNRGTRHNRTVGVFTCSGCIHADPAFLPVQ